MEKISKPNKNLTEITPRLEALLRDCDIVENSSSENWRKHDQALVLFATGLLFVLTQIASIPKWVFLIISFVMASWAVLFITLFWDAVVRAKYRSSIRAEIDYLLGEKTLSARESIEDRYWNPEITKRELGISNPRAFAQIFVFSSLFVFYIIFTKMGIEWYIEIDMFVVWVLIILYVIIFPTVVIIAFKKLQSFVIKHIFEVEIFKHENEKKI